MAALEELLLHVCELFKHRTEGACLERLRKHMELFKDKTREVEHCTHPSQSLTVGSRNTKRMTFICMALLVCAPTMNVCLIQSLFYLFFWAESQCLLHIFCFRSMLELDAIPAFIAVMTNFTALQ